MACPARSANAAASTSPPAAGSWRHPVDGGSIVPRRPPQVVEHPDLLPDPVAALAGDLAILLARSLRVQESELGVDPVELALGLVQVGHRLARKRSGPAAHRRDPPPAEREQPQLGRAPIC